jgi:DNA-binding XRE family transcriptional regulator
MRLRGLQDGARPVLEGAGKWRKFKGCRIRIFMNKHEFSHARARLGKSQLQMADLLRTSAKAIQSYEQGWRSIPAHAERQMLFLLALKGRKRARKPCWTVRNCSAEQRRNCPAWEFKAGSFCWFINGTLCEGKVQHDWHKKMQICRSCGLMASILRS